VTLNGIVESKQVVMAGLVPAIHVLVVSMA